MAVIVSAQLSRGIVIALYKARGFYSGTCGVAAGGRSHNRPSRTISKRQGGRPARVSKNASARRLIKFGK